MSKICLIADTHLGVRNDNIHFHEYFKRSMKQFLKVIDDEKIKHVVHLGDLFDRRKYVNFVSLNVCRKYFLEPLNERGIETHIIAGNHDEYYKDTCSITSLDEIIEDRYDNIYCYSKATVVNIAGKDILLIPWITDDNHHETLELIKKAKTDIAMGHLEIEGFQMFKGVVKEHGLNRTIFNRFDKVFSGHFHHPSSAGNIYYIGAFGAYTWSDYNDDRGFCTFDLDTRGISMVRNQENIFKAIEYSDKDNEKIFEEIHSIDYSQYKNCYVKVKCLSRTDPYAFDMLIENIQSVEPIDISVDDVSMISTVSGNTTDEGVEIKDTTDIIYDYIDSSKLSVESARMKTFMKTLYDQAISSENV